MGVSVIISFIDGSKVKKVKYKKRGLLTYSHFHEMFADPVNPMSEEKRTYNLLRVYEGLDALDSMLHPEAHYWQSVADAVNMLITLTVDMGLAEDPDGLITTANKTLHDAWTRAQTIGCNTLTAGEITALRAVVAEYASLSEIIPERAMIRCHRMTEKRMQEILNGKRREGDIVI